MSDHRIPTDEMRAILAESPNDTDLGMKMAADARKVSNGEMSEDRFYEKYSDAVREEFGVEDWADGGNP